MSLTAPAEKSKEIGTRTKIKINENHNIHIIKILHSIGSALHMTRTERQGNKIRRY